MNEKQFFERLKQSPRPVVVDFWAPWCMPCRVIGPVVDKLGKDYAGRVDVWKINADEQPELLRSLRIYGIPTLSAYHQGEEFSRRTGAASPAVLTTLFEAALSGEKVVRSGPSNLDRLLRLSIGAALLFLAIYNHFAGFYVLAAVAGAVIAFGAVYDRCPIYKALTTRMNDWLKKDSNNPTE